MCCFSGPVRVVSDTSIFARASGDGRQFIVYSMRVDAPAEVAMILPIPVLAGAGENAVRFIDLQAFPTFFDDLEGGFPEPLSRAPAGKAVAPQPQTLRVVEVGSFIASFVPTVADFDRVDERFRLPRDVWSRLPQYADFGFAVFQLKPGDRKVHPMAFEFPRKDPEQLFFSTVHIHDGEVHPSAGFDHALFCQVDVSAVPQSWWASQGSVGDFVPNHGRSQGILDPFAPCYRLRLRGELKNEDVVVPT
jgi:hypothetical protein